MITEVKYKNHRILGNLHLSFTKADSTPYKVIVFAGENGSGKTSIMKSFLSFLGGKELSGFEYIKFTQKNEEYTMLPPKDESEQDFAKSYGLHYVKTNNGVIHRNYTISDSIKKITLI